MSKLKSQILLCLIEIMLCLCRCGHGTVKREPRAGENKGTRVIPEALQRENSERKKACDRKKRATTTMHDVDDSRVCSRSSPLFSAKTKPVARTHGFGSLWP